MTISAMVSMARGNHDEAFELLQKSLVIARGLGRDWVLATSLLNLGLGSMAVGDLGRSREVIGEALCLYEELGDEYFHARCLGYLGHVSLLEDDPLRARSCSSKAFSPSTISLIGAGWRRDSMGCPRSAQESGYPNEPH